MYKERTGVMDQFHLEKMFSANAALLGARLGSKAVRLLAGRLTEYLGSPHEDRYTYMWRAAIEAHDQDEYRSSFGGVLLDGLRDTLLAFIREDAERARPSVAELLQSPYPTLIRAGIFACGDQYPIPGNVFWDYCEASWFVDVKYWHEMYWFVRKCFQKFSTVERMRFRTVVDSIHGDWGDPARAAELDEGLRRDILAAAAGLGDVDVDERYKSLVAKYGLPREHLDFHVYMSSSSCSQTPSAFTAEEIAGWSANAIYANFNAMDTSDQATIEPALVTAVRASSDGFDSKLDAFRNLGAMFQRAVLRGLRQRWAEDKRDIRWSRVLTFCGEVVQIYLASRDANTVVVANEDPVQLSKEIAELLKAGAASDRTMPSECIPVALSVLLPLLDVEHRTPASLIRDAVTKVINTPHGRVLETFIHLALALRRTATTQDAITAVWQQVGPTLDSQLEVSVCGESMEFAVLGAIYCPNLHYISPAWVQGNFERLFPRANRTAWNCAAQGFAYVNHWYSWLFEGLKRGGHLKTMLSAADLPESVAEKAVQFLALGYVNGAEEIGQSPPGLLDELIEKQNIPLLSSMCWFFWTLRDSDAVDEKQRQRIVQFWIAVNEALAEDRDIELRSALNLLASHVSSLTSEIEHAWIQVAPYADVAHHANVLVTELARLAGTAPDSVVRIFLAVLDRFVPDYPGEKVIECVKAIASAGQVEGAQEICVRYFELGSMLLNDTYRELREAQKAH